MRRGVSAVSSGRGTQPFPNAREGPDWWSHDDYAEILGNMVRQRANFAGFHTVRARLGRLKVLSNLSVSQSKSILYRASVWARRALNGRKRRFPARAVLVLGADELDWPAVRRRCGRDGARWGC